MRRFAAGMLVAMVVLGVVALVWFSLNDQAKGLILGLIMGGVGMVVGVILALAIVAVFLLYNLRWQIQGKSPPVIMAGSGHPALAAPDPSYTYYPPQAAPQGRPVRSWQGVGVEDMPSPATRPMEE